MRAHIPIDAPMAYNSYKKKQVEKLIKDKEREEERYRKEKNEEVVQIILTVFCYVLHKRYRWSGKTLQKIINETYTTIIQYDREHTASGKDWVTGVRFWGRKMGLRFEGRINEHEGN